MTTQPEVFFVTGEVSGDRHAAPVVRELRALGLRVTGVGGQWMREAGAQLLADTTDWGAMGVPASLRKAPYLVVQSRLLLRQIRRRRPAVVVLVDFGFFNCRMARHLRRMAVTRIFYYFPPGSWRQEAGDWSGLARVTDCIATPFERNAENLRASGANAHWVGHPAVDVIEPVADREAFRREAGLPDGSPVLGLLPGSRASERRVLGPRLLEAAELIREKLPGSRFLWSALPGLGRGEARLRESVEARKHFTAVEDSRLILRGSDLVLTAMGTATLEAAAALTPMVATYDGPAVAKWIAVRILKQRRAYYSMPNILLGREAVLEVVPRSAAEVVRPQELAQAALAVLGDEAWRQRMVEDLQQVRLLLGEPGVARRTAALIAELAGGPSPAPELRAGVGQP